MSDSLPDGNGTNPTATTAMAVSPAPPTPAPAMPWMPDVTKQLYEVLEPLTPEFRLRAVHATLVMLGDNLPLRGPVAKTPAGPPQKWIEDDYGDGSEDAGDGAGFPPEAQKWLQKHSLSKETLNHYFHMDEGKVTVIASPSASKTKKEQTVDAYLLQGVAALLQTGNAAFTDDEARGVCEHLGCFDRGNHAKTVQSFGNRFTGSKKEGWKLTVPGLDAAAELLKQAQS